MAEEEETLPGDTLPDLARRVDFKGRQSSRLKSETSRAEPARHISNSSADQESRKRGHLSDSVTTVIYADEDNPHDTTASVEEAKAGREAQCHLILGNSLKRRVVSQPHMDQNVSNRGPASRQSMISERRGNHKDSSRRSQLQTPGSRIFKTVMKDLRSNQPFSERLIYKRVPKTSSLSESLEPENLIPKESGSDGRSPYAEETENSIPKDSGTGEERSQGEENRTSISESSGSGERRRSHSKEAENFFSKDSAIAKLRRTHGEGSRDSIPEDLETDERRRFQGKDTEISSSEDSKIGSEGSLGEETENTIPEDSGTGERRRSLKSVVFKVGADGKQLPRELSPDYAEQESSEEIQVRVHGDSPSQQLDYVARTTVVANRGWMPVPEGTDLEHVSRENSKPSCKRKLKQSRLSEVGVKRIKREGGTWANVVSLPRVLKAESFNCDYYEHFYTPDEAGELFEECEESLQYLEGELATIKLYGRTIPLPRRQVAFGDDGLNYTYSRMTVPAKPWTTFLEEVRRKIEDVTACRFNFVLINRYKDGYDSIGEHRDDEADLDYKHPIASLSLGQPRDFMFRHMDSRGKFKKRDMDSIQLQLQHGSLFMMNFPTNQFWYHSLPKRPSQSGVRINMTFRKILRHTDR